MGNSSVIVSASCQTHTTNISAPAAEKIYRRNSVAENGSETNNLENDSGINDDSATQDISKMSNSSAENKLSEYSTENSSSVNNLTTENSCGNNSEIDEGIQQDDLAAENTGTNCSEIENNVEENDSEDENISEPENSPNMYARRRSRRNEDYYDTCNPKEALVWLSMGYDSDDMVSISTSVTPDLELEFKCEYPLDVIGMELSAALIIPEENAIVIVERSFGRVRVYSMGGDKMYWPRICFDTLVAAKCLDFNLESRYLTLGLYSGIVLVYHIAEDYIKFACRKQYRAHLGTTNSVKYVSGLRCTLSCGDDSRFVCQSKQNLVQYQGKSSYTCMQFHSESRQAFVGNSAGVIDVLKLEFSRRNRLEGITIVRSLKRHNGAVTSLLLNEDYLYSGGIDGSIVVWKLEQETIQVSSVLTKQIAGIQHLIFMENHLISIASDRTVCAWDMIYKRLPPGDWRDSDSCDICSVPFLWNFKSMIENCTSGVSRHHCRSCGRAICAQCCSHAHSDPRLGLERPVKTCDYCHYFISNQRIPTRVLMTDLGETPMHAAVDSGPRILATIGADLNVKIWDTRLAFSF